MRIAIVNDMPMVRELLRRLIAGIPDCEVAWSAGDGQEAVEKCAEDTPDLLIMDIVMPRLDGVGATRQIMKKSPCPILIVTATVDGNSANVFEALGEGAVDAVNTPLAEDMSNDEGRFQEVVRKIRIMQRLAPPHTTLAGSHHVPPRTATAPMVAIGASTGGPKAIDSLLAVIPRDFHAMFTVVQHIDQQFANGMAGWLGANCALPVRTVVADDIPQTGMVLLAATNDHMIMTTDGRLDYVLQPENNPFRPSVDVYFNSLAANWPTPGIAVLLTGIGNDGAAGLLRLRQAGWSTFAQDRDSCVVYGMPKAAAKLGAAQEVLPPAEIGKRIISLIVNWNG